MISHKEQTIELLERAIERLRAGWAEGALIEETNHVVKVCALGSLLPEEAFENMEDWIELPEETTPENEKEFGKGQYDHFRPWVYKPSFGASCQASRCTAVSELALAIKQQSWSKFDRENWAENVETQMHQIKASWNRAGYPALSRAIMKEMAEHEANTILVYGFNDSQDSEEGVEAVIAVFEKAIANIRAATQEPVLA